MHRLSFFLLLTALLLPNECIHSSVLVVWGYLGWALPCLMSSEAKISILASEWLGSLVARLSGVFFFPFSLGSNWFHLEAQRNNKELGQANKYIQRDSEGKMNFLLFILRWLFEFMDSPQNFVLHGSWKVDILGKTCSKKTIPNSCTHSLTVKQSCCHYTANLFCWSHSWQLAPALCTETQAVSLSVEGLSQPLPPN